MLVRGRSTVNVHAGAWVEVGDRHVVEGAWSGDYDAGDFTTAHVFSGTGLRTTSEGLVLATPTDTLQPLYLLYAEDRLFCSNSLAFLLAAADDDVDPDYPHYDLDLITIMFGLRRYRRTLPTRAGQTIRLYYHANVVVTRTLETRVVAKAGPPPFGSFGAYRTFLSDTIARVVANAVASGRRQRYRSLATVSSGYDSPACAVLARAAGCEETVTFRRARADFATQEDSGRTIAEYLGLRVTEFDADAYRHRSDFPEVEFCVAGGGEDVVMSVLEDSLRARLLFTGYHGDKVWSRINHDVGPHIVRGDASGCSLAEFRLRVGFLNVAVPFAGAVGHPSIHGISNSAEMHPWSLPDTAYDRPIPRRIVEEAGVPRALFGQVKKAVTMPYQRAEGVNPQLEEVMSPISHAAFASFAAARPLFKGFVDRATYATLHGLYRLNDRALESYALNRLATRVGRPLPKGPWMPWRYGKERAPHSLVFHWAMQRLRPRYLTLR